MTTDNKTLADVQPGGRVRLGDGLMPCPFCGNDAEFVPYKNNGLTLKCKSMGCIQRHQRTIRYGIDWLRTSMTEHWNARALSAQLSPAGQGDAITAEMVEAATSEFFKGHTWSAIGDRSAVEAKMRGTLEAALAARQPVECKHCDGSGSIHGTDCGGCQPVGQEPVVYEPSRNEKAPYFECTSEQWERHTKGMTEKGARMLANMLAHHCLLARRDDRGWIITRFDLIRSGKPWWHVSNEGVLTYDYDPDTKARAVCEALLDSSKAVKS